MKPRPQELEPPGPFDRTAAAWAALGFPGEDWCDSPPTEPADRARTLIECSALTPDEIAILEWIEMGGDNPCLPITAEMAGRMLARWRGPIPGLKLVPLAHWKLRRVQ